MSFPTLHTFIQTPGSLIVELKLKYFDCGSKESLYRNTLRSNGTVLEYKSCLKLNITSVRSVSSPVSGALSPGNGRNMTWSSVQPTFLQLPNIEMFDV